MTAQEDTPSDSPDQEPHPKIDVGVFTHVGDPSVHPNEDRATCVLDLLGKFAPPNTKYEGTSGRQVSFFGVYDGHGGSSCSEHLRKHLHGNIAKQLYKQNYHEKIKPTLINVFEETEEKECYKFAPGSCCTTVLIKGRKIYNATAGDSMAVLFQEERGSMKMTKLNDRHGCEFSKREITRLKKAQAEISKDYETEGAVIARDSRGKATPGLIDFWAISPLLDATARHVVMLVVVPIICLLIGRLRFQRVTFHVSRLLHQGALSDPWVWRRRLQGARPSQAGGRCDPDRRRRWLRRRGR